MSELHLILQDKTLKGKAKCILISNGLLEKKLLPAELAQVAATLKEVDVANCLEGLELATKTKPELAGAKGIEFAISKLPAKAPRVKWEAARVVANCIHLHPVYAEKAALPLLQNTEHTGTVVRWSTALALAQIIQLPGKSKTELIAALHNILLNEENSGVRKIYERALKGR
jgi:hypothetical protein